MSAPSMPPFRIGLWACGTKADLNDYRGVLGLHTRDDLEAELVLQK